MNEENKNKEMKPDDVFNSIPSILAVDPTEEVNLTNNNEEIIELSNEDDTKEDIMQEQSNQGKNESDENLEIPSNSYTDEELLRAFIGVKYDKIAKLPFNFYGFLFPPFYMFYRKMFIQGIICFVVILIISTIFNNLFVPVLSCVICGFLMNKLYLIYAKREIQKIKKQKKDQSFFELRNICFSRGGTDKYLLIRGTIIVAIIIVVYMIITKLIGIDIIIPFV